MNEATEAARAAKLLTTQQAAERIGFSAGTLENWRCAGEGPPYVKIGRAVRYSVAGLERWIAEQAGERR
jgi:predicted DNA-binding transcriptional regulator AlpA